MTATSSAYRTENKQHSPSYGQQGRKRGHLGGQHGEGEKKNSIHPVLAAISPRFGMNWIAQKGGVCR
jgi:hypothetical protein